MLRLMQTLQGLAYADSAKFAWLMTVILSIPNQNFLSLESCASAARKTNDSQRAVTKYCSTFIIASKKDIAQLSISLFLYKNASKCLQASYYPTVGNLTLQM